MRKITLFLSLFIISFIISCDSTDPKPPEKPPGYQEDIPWPSLADSPWPIYRGDPQNTNRSKYNSVQGMLDWKIDSIYIWSGITLDENNNLYFVGQSGLYSYKQDGTLRWIYKYQTSDGEPTPLITSTGKIICAKTRFPEPYIYALNLDGNFLWRIDGYSLVNESFTISKDGLLYGIVFDEEFVLIEINLEGTITWRSAANIFSPGLRSLAFAPTGEILYCSTGFQNEKLIAFNIRSKNVVWGYNGNVRFGVSVNNNGELFFHSFDSVYEVNLVALNSDGTEKWKKGISINSDYEAFKGVAIDYLGSIYSKFEDSENPDGSVAKFTNEGSIEWIKNAIGFRDFTTTDRNLNVYYTQSIFPEVIVNSLSSKGEQNWLKKINSNYTNFSAPLVINSNSQMFIIQQYKKLIQSIR